MARISIKSADQIPFAPSPSGCESDVRAYIDGPRDAIHLHHHAVRPDGVLRLGPFASDSAIFIWAGEVVTDGRSLPAGSSLLLEPGATVDLLSQGGSAQLLCFAANPAKPGGADGAVRLHLLPASTVPHYVEGTVGRGLRGALHADASFAPCPVWLHENHLPPPAPDAPPADPNAGIHSHAEAEVIFVTAGEMRLGNRLYGPGTSLAIAAETMYGFSVGPGGLSLVNFRSGRPDAIRFKSGMTIDEVGYWRSRCASPAYISLHSASAAP